MHGLRPISHSALPTMTTALAHRIMQDHLDCPITVCARKLQAKLWLVATGALHPADRPHFGI
ncbi:hypothetical protein B7C42_01818 [Nocardia cerradoensis]|uniref:Uncharacterized protein n=1 Tax=Nocardia cerradoensis TaxID=85688 RepID=A0A231HD41_9NOCA|nr:hypothetical protein [Nocardia cerradoensis]OXR46840.1 hypothetical protein B7C42_01818 [Nocardia cerradoensis]